MKANKNIEKETPNKVYEERFKMLMKLIRIDQMLKKATIVFPPNTHKK